ncbi:MAG: polysaccharide deacetylase family protein [Rhodocyclales bacterium GT-UBC]|nr:MAG: polysaccharide deacetylase family protein [Rhodocyclales bacterium GT-UBC]
MLRLITRAFSPGGAQGNLSVLFFHRVVAERDPLSPDEPTAAEFDRLLGWLQRQFTVISLSEGVSRLANGNLPPAAAAITFDDGYFDNLSLAAPLLQKRNLPATLFVATDYIDGGIMFNDMVIEALRKTNLSRLDLSELDLPVFELEDWSQRRAAVNAILRAIKHQAPAQRLDTARAVVTRCDVTLPQDLMMSREHLREFSRHGFEIGAHTGSHPILTKLDDADAYRDIQRSRTWLEECLDRRIGLFAYPNGKYGQDFDSRHRDMARACGFDAAFSTEPGVCSTAADRWALPRFTPWDRSPGRFALRMLANCRNRPTAA